MRIQEATAPRLARELRTLLDDPAFDTAARDVAARLRPIDGAGAAAARILEHLDRISR